MSDPDVWESIWRLAEERMRFIAANREKLIEAWIAETGLKPSESVLVEQRMNDGETRVHVKKLPVDDRCEQCSRPVTYPNHYALWIGRAWHWGCEVVDDDGNSLSGVRVGNQIKQGDIIRLNVPVVRP